MKKILTLVLMLGTVVLIGCANKTNAAETKHFEEVSYQELGNITGDNQDQIFVIKNKETGKKFVIFKGYRRGGIAPLD